MRKAYSAPAIFTGREWIHDFTILTKDGLIEEIISYSEGGAGIASHKFEDCVIVPAFIDIQVYGAEKKLFSAYPEPETLRVMNETFRTKGTVLFQPTVATNSPAIFRKCIDAVRAYWNEGGTGVAGLHLEGPWINPEKKGAHIKEFIHPPDKKEVRDILDYGRGVIRTITLAPEVCNQDILELLKTEDIIISAGHSNAGYQQAVEGFERGINAVTHLFNAMSGLHHREPGLVGAALDYANVMASIIPDGHHVAFEVIRIAARNMEGRLFAITDAVTETSIGPYQHQLAGDKYESSGILSGSALSMHKAFLNLVQEAGIPEDIALRMCSLYPAQAIHCDQKYGRIAPGFSAEFLVLDSNRNFVTLVTG